MKSTLQTCIGVAIAITFSTIIAAMGQPAVVTNVPANSSNLVQIGDLIYFTSGESLWRTDGTASGTFQLNAAGFNQAAQWQQPAFARPFKEKAFFVNANSTQLWRSDGTPSGTVLLKTSSSGNVRILDVTDSYLFFVASDPATGEEVYRTDGTLAGTALTKDINPGAANGYKGVAAALNNEFFFAANNNVNGTELWKTSGTSSGTVMVSDINPGPGDGFVGDVNGFTFNNRFFFRGNTMATGSEPWVSDGTSAGTTMLKDATPGTASSGPIDYAIANSGGLYFMILDELASDAGDLWKTEGTPSSTAFIKTIGEKQSNHSYYRFLTYRGKIYFWDRQDYFADNLWVSDGTAAGTHSFFNIMTMDGNISFFEVVNDFMLFTASNQNIPHQFYRSDGTSGGTTIFADFKARAIGTYPRDITKVDDLVFYADHDGPTEEISGQPHSEDDYYHLFQADGVTTTSTRTLWGVNTVGTDNITNFSGKVVFTTYNDQYGSGDGQKRLWIYDPAVPPSSSAYFTLVDAQSDTDIRRLTDGASISNEDGVPLNIRFTPEGPAGSVVFKLNGTVTRTETSPPYTLAGDVNGDYAPWQGAKPGRYTLTATPYSQAGGQGNAGESLTITFTIECTSQNGDCLPTGEMLREVWANVPGNSVSSIPLNSEPDEKRYVGVFEGPLNAGTNYGARYRGYVIPPVTGNYTFWIASNDNSELWLSTDDQPANKRRIAFVVGATNSREWSKYTSQQSVSITLSEGQKYYVEALHKQGAGSDHLAVGWRLPDGTLERPIPGNRLSPFLLGSAQAPTVRVTSPGAGATFNAPADITIMAEASDGDEQTVTRVDFYVSESGAPVRKIGEDVSAPYSFPWQDVRAGRYELYAFATDTDGNVTGSSPVNIIVNGGTECLASGSITRDYWAGVTGDRVSGIPVNASPTASNQLTIFEGPSNIGDNYGTRIRGYICPPATGAYKFWIASNDYSELWLSTDADPVNKVRIAYINGATNPRQWDKFASQVSATIMLTQGQRYYIEALHKEGVGSDHIAVGWLLPDGTVERPIPGSRLSPFENTLSPSFAREQDESLLSQIGIYPNPVGRDVGELNIAGYEGIVEPVETEIQIIKMTGEVVFSEKILCGGDCSTYLIKLHERLVPGLYIVNLKTDGARHLKRLVVE